MITHGPLLSRMHDGLSCATSAHSAGWSMLQGGLGGAVGSIGRQAGFRGPPGANGIEGGHRGRGTLAAAANGALPIRSPADQGLCFPAVTGYQQQRGPDTRLCALDHATRCVRVAWAAPWWIVGRPVIPWFQPEDLPEI